MTEQITLCEFTDNRKGHTYYLYYDSERKEFIVMQSDISIDIRTGKQYAPGTDIEKEREYYTFSEDDYASSFDNYDDAREFFNELVKPALLDKNYTVDEAYFKNPNFNPVWLIDNRGDS